MLKLKCYYEREIFSNPSSNYRVIGCSSDDEDAACVETRKGIASTKGLYKIVAVISDSAYEFKKTKGLAYIFEGEVVTSKYGKQLKVSKIEEYIGTEKEDIILYLCGIKGIGMKTAKRIYDVFGNDSMKVLAESPEKLKRVKGFTAKKISAIIADYSKNIQMKEVIDYFSEFSISSHKINNIYRTLGSAAIEMVKENPFSLSRYNDLLSWSEANSIAVAIGVKVQSPERIEQCVEYVIKKMFHGIGDLYYSVKDIAKYCLPFLNKNISTPTLITNENRIYCEIEQMIKNGKLIPMNIGADKYVYEINDYLCEKLTAQKLVDFSHYPDSQFNMSRNEILQELVNEEKKYGIKLGYQQIEAIVMALSSNLSIITGGPGTGKTTILKFILDIFRKKYSRNITLCAPTGKAARRMSESTGIEGASTIHSLLNLEEDHQWAPGEPNTVSVDSDLIVVDEMSMIDMQVMYLFMASVNYKSKIIFLGDADQLPSVGPGEVLRNMIQSNVIPTTVLDKIYRQSEQSSIVINSYNINHKNAKLIEDKDFCIIKNNPGEAINDQLVDIYIEELKKNNNNLDSVQLLTPYRSNNYFASVIQLNKKIQGKINPSGAGKREIKLKYSVFREGDKVIQQKNTQIIKNGDIGIIKKIYFDSDARYNAEIDFGDNRIVSYTSDEMVEYFIDLAYVLTVHKTQGSEYKTVIMPVINDHLFMLKRNLIYTGWTRAKQKLIMVGDIVTLKKAIQQETPPRKTMLTKRMIARNERYLNKTPICFK